VTIGGGGKILHLESDRKVAQDHRVTWCKPRCLFEKQKRRVRLTTPAHDLCVEVMGHGAILVHGYRLLEEILRPGRVVHGLHQERGAEGERITALRVKLAGLLGSNQSNQIDKLLGPKSKFLFCPVRSASIVEGKAIREGIHVANPPNKTKQNKIKQNHEGIHVANPLEQTKQNKTKQNRPMRTFT
jgi:hypothetical protein